MLTKSKLKQNLIKDKKKEVSVREDAHRETQFIPPPWFSNFAFEAMWNKTRTLIYSLCLTAIENKSHIKPTIHK